MISSVSGADLGGRGAKGTILALLSLLIQYLAHHSQNYLYPSKADLIHKYTILQVQMIPIKLYIGGSEGEPRGALPPLDFSFAPPFPHPWMVSPISGWKLFTVFL